MGAKPLWDRVKAGARQQAEETEATVILKEKNQGADEIEELLAGLNFCFDSDGVVGNAEKADEAEMGPAAGQQAKVAEERLPVVQASADAPDDIDLINKEFFIAPDGSGKPTIWQEQSDPETGHARLTAISVGEFKLLLSNRFAEYHAPTGMRRVPLAEAWLRSERRRQFLGGIALVPDGTPKPDVFYLFKGFAVAPSEGDATLALEHVRMLCSGNAELAEYFLNAMALIVQRPGTRLEVALVLRGAQGTGKGTLFRMLGKIFGRHFLHITNSRHLVGNFNSHLRHALVVFVDEGYWAGDKSAEGVLKGLITEPSVAIEMKGRDVFMAPNRITVFMASNNAFVVPAGADERRYFVVDVPPSRAQDHAYFGKLNEWIDSGGAGIFLRHLLDRELKGFNPRAVPHTSALDSQKIENMPALDRWILDALDTATSLGGGNEWGEERVAIECGMAAEGYEAYCRRAGIRAGRIDTRAIGRRLHEAFGCGPASATVGSRVSRRRAWSLPGLSEARQMAASAFGLRNYGWGQA